MNILINATNQKGLGGVQVTDSFCRCLERYPQHKFVVVLTDRFTNTVDYLNSLSNVITISYAIKNSFETLLFGRDQFLDSLIDKYQVDGVLTMFAPSRWNPRVPHLAGFALSQLVIPESPFYQILTLKESIKQKIRNAIWTHYFRRGTHFLYTENPFITERLRKKWSDFQVITVTNYYNQVFDQPERWICKKIPDFEGTTLICLAGNAKHKNLPITKQISRILRDKHPEFKFRFVFPTTEADFPVEDDIKEHFLLIDRVSVEECPSLYQQCDIAFQPTLLECFTATFPEAMRIEKPIIACDLDFARGLCEDAALYFKWDSAEEAADLIYEVSVNKELSQKLINAGRKQLRQYDDYSQRAEKLINNLVRLINEKSLY